MLKVKKLLSNSGYVYLLALMVIAVGLCLAVNLVKELQTPNHGFYGTHYDFLAFYTAASTALHHNISQLYSAASLTTLQRQIIPHPVGAAGYMPFLNPPFTAVLLAPLALFGVNTARLLWLGISLVISVFVLSTLTRQLRPLHRRLATGMLLVTFPMYQAFIEGQLSLLVLLSGCLAYLFFNRRQKIRSGVSLLLLWVMPQFTVFALLGLLIKREWAVLKGWLISSAILGMATLPITGYKIYFTYIRVLISTTGNHFIDLTTSAPLTWRGAINLSMGINGFYSALLGQGHVRLVNFLYFVTSLILVFCLIRAVLAIGAKSTKEQGAMLLAASLLTVILIDPHLFAQNLILVYLLIPLAYVLFKARSFYIVTAIAVVCDLAWLDQYIRLHIFTVITFIATTYLITQAVKLSPRNA